MFTLSDVREIALQIERNGESAYRRAAQISRAPDIARLLSQMADEEKKHAHWFECLDVSSHFVPKDPLIEQMGRELLQRMVAQQTFSMDADRLAASMDVEELLDQAIEFENDTILFYQMLHNFMDDSATMSQLERIIEEEQTHIERLNELFGKHKLVDCAHK